MNLRLLPRALAWLAFLAPFFFLTYNFANDSLGSAAELTGLLTGLVCGSFLAKGVVEISANSLELAAPCLDRITVQLVEHVPHR